MKFSRRLRHSGPSPHGVEVEREDPDAAIPVAEVPVAEFPVPTLDDRILAEPPCIGEAEVERRFRVRVRQTDETSLPD